MIVLGLEGTAHTISAGIVDGKRILSNASSTVKPRTGGIHPREAAIHHAENILGVLQSSLREAGTSMKDVDLVAFSMGPGLGPCLRVVATAARALSLEHSKPILGVNHPLGHVEIGRMLTGARDPVMLYVSGGNTQVIAHRGGRYRVFGETIDIGIGNMLDKLARDLKLPFPGGPRIEELASRGHEYLSLPYSVHGMDTSFSGIYTAAKALLAAKHPVEDVCYSVQETSFSMLVEVLERALHYLGKTEILLAGGVARNERLRGMVREMGREQEVRVNLTSPDYCMDNGAMIARAGLLMYESGQRQNIDDTTVIQRYRIDEVETPWIESVSRSEEMKGAESIISRETYLGRRAVSKVRPAKGYRIRALDEEIRRTRMRNELGVAVRLHEAGLEAPLPFLLDQERNELKMQDMECPTLRMVLMEDGSVPDIVKALGRAVGKMHESGISHGDLTTGNVLIKEGKICFIDGSMGSVVAETKDLGQDLFLLKESFQSMHGDLPGIWADFLKAYRRSHDGASRVLDELKRIESTRRYV